MIRRFIHGAPLKHPLHPALVHYPIGLFTLTVLLDLANVFLGGTAWLSIGAGYTLAGGVLVALLAAVPGLGDWSEIRADHPGKSRATLHMALNISAVVMMAASFLLRRAEIDQPGVSLLPVLLSIVGFALVMGSGYIGGWLVYDQGIGVGRYRRETDLPDRTVQVSTSKTEDGYVPIAEADQIKSGESLRVEVDGEVMAVVRVGDLYHAFNEFCTHRFGPLSDGALYNNQVECPWHRSCFDIRTGDVIEGPAQLDLKSYPVEVRDGKIFVNPNPQSKNS
jgi:nitrite reductase/ring-hydroxylating ferredoxin subunit/uncharacterized membrane protein